MVVRNCYANMRDISHNACCPVPFGSSTGSKLNNTEPYEVLIENCIFDYRGRSGQNPHGNNYVGWMFSGGVGLM